MRSVVSSNQFLSNRQQPKRVCPICRKFYVYFCVVCCTNALSTKTTIQSPHQSSSYFYIAKDTIFKLLLVVCSYVFNASVKLTKVIDLKKDDSLESIYFRHNMDEDSGVDSKQETLSTTSTISNESNRSATEQKSSVSLHSRKSSNVFIQLMRSRKKNKSKQELDTIPAAVNEIVGKSVDSENKTESPKTLSPKTSKSRIPVPVQKKEEREVQTLPLKVDLGQSDEILTENTQIQSNSSTFTKTKKGNSFFNKFIKKQSNRDSSSLTCERRSTGTENDFDDTRRIIDAISETNTSYANDDTASEDFTKAVLPMKYNMRFCSPTLDVTLADALQQVLDIETKLKDDQIHVTQMLEKYIHDPGFKKELLDAVYQYSKLQIDTERRIQNLANEMWIQQSEISRNQENNLQDSLNALLKQNRNLQEENEHLLRKNEKLSAKVASFAYLTPRTNLGGNHVVDSLTRNNEQLHLKLNATMKHMTELEDDLQKIQRHNERLEEKLRNSNTQIQNYKTMLQRSKAESDLEIATMNQKLQTNVALIKNSTEAGDVLIEDLDALKRKLKASTFSLNWTKFKCRGNTLTDLIHMSRVCINELSQELIDLQTQAALKEKDSDCLKEQIEQQQNEIFKLKEDLCAAKDKEDVLKEYQVEKQQYTQKNLELQKENDGLQEEINRLTQLVEKMESDYQTSHNHIEQLKDEISEKAEQLENVVKVMDEVKSENRDLIIQIHNLNKVLCESGAGDMAKQFAETQERMSYFENCCYQLTNEKNCLIEQVNSENLKIEHLMQQQQMYNNRLQAQQKEVEMLTKETISLNEQLHAEKITIVALQEERKRYLEEKHILRNIHEQLKKEIAHSEQLKVTVANMSKETYKLTILADCNKLLGEKLKMEVKQREETITQLQNNIKTLSNANLETTRDKIALCMELNEASNAKDYLSNVLETEVKKSATVEESKKQSETEALTKLRALERMQKAERFALRKLLEDYKKVVAQRDQLLQKQQEWCLQISSLQENYEMQMKTSTEINNKYKEKEQSLKEMEQFLEEKQLLLNQYQVEIENYRISYAHSSGKIEELKAENSKLETSVTYLQNTCQKLHNDFNNAKAAEVELQNAMQSEMKQNEKLQSTIETLNTNLHNVEQEKNSLVSEIKRLTSACDKLINEYQENLKVTAIVEKRNKKEIQDLKFVVNEKSRHIQSLEETISAKANEIRELKTQCKTLQNDSVQKLVAEEELGIQGRLLNEANANYQKLFDEFKQLQEKYENTLSQSMYLSQELNTTKKELETLLKEKDEEYSTYTTQLEEIRQGFNEENDNLRESLEGMCQRYEELKSIYQREEMSSRSLSDSHKDLSTRLLRAVRMLIDEKVARQSERCRLEVVTEEIEKLKAEKEVVLAKVSTLLTELHTLQKEYDSLKTEKTTLETTFEQCKKFYENMGSDSASVEQDSSTNRLQAELHEAQNLIQRLQFEIEKLTKDINSLEFQKCEMSLRIHELQGEVNTEKSLNAALRQSQQRFFDTVVQLKDNGEINDSVLNALVERNRCGVANN